MSKHYNKEYVKYLLKESEYRELTNREKKYLTEVGLGGLVTSTWPLWAGVAGLTAKHWVPNVADALITHGPAMASGAKTLGKGMWWLTKNGVKGSLAAAKIGYDYGKLGVDSIKDTIKDSNKVVRVKSKDGKRVKLIRKGEQRGPFGGVRSTYERDYTDFKKGGGLHGRKVKECINLLCQLNGKSFNENIKVFSKMYSSFLNNHRSLIQESLTYNVTPIDLFKECLIQKLKESYTILDEKQEKFLYDMLTKNKYIKENRLFIQNYYKNGMRFMLNEGIDPINYRAVILLNEKLNWKIPKFKMPKVKTPKFKKPDWHPVKSTKNWLDRKWNGYSTGGTMTSPDGTTHQLPGNKRVAGLKDTLGYALPSMGKELSKKFGLFRLRHKALSGLTKDQQKDLLTYLKTYQPKRVADKNLFDGNTIKGKGYRDVPQEFTAYDRDGNEIKIKGPSTSTSRAGFYRFLSKGQQGSLKDIAPEEYSDLIRKYRSGAPMKPSDKKKLSKLDRLMGFSSRTSNIQKDFNHDQNLLDLDRDREIERLSGRNNNSDDNNNNGGRRRRGEIDELRDKVNRIRGRRADEARAGRNNPPQTQNPQQPAPQTPNPQQPVPAPRTPNPQQPAPQTPNPQQPVPAPRTPNPQQPAPQTPNPQQPVPAPQTPNNKPERTPSPEEVLNKENADKASKLNKLFSIFSKRDTDSGKHTPKEFAKFIHDSNKAGYKYAKKIEEDILSTKFGKDENGTQQPGNVMYGMFANVPIENPSNPNETIPSGTHIWVFGGRSKQAGEILGTDKDLRAENLIHSKQDKNGKTIYVYTPIDSKTNKKKEIRIYPSTYEAHYLKELQKELAALRTADQQQLASYYDFTLKYRPEIKLAESRGISSRNFYQLYLIEKIKEVYGIR